jgi:hypothetical protein
MLIMCIKPSPSILQCVLNPQVSRESKEQRVVLDTKRQFVRFIRYVYIGYSIYIVYIVYKVILYIVCIVYKVILYLDSLWDSLGEFGVC